MKILVLPQQDEQWCWLLRGVGGVTLAVSSSAFPSYAQAMGDAQTAMVGMRDAVVHEENGYICIPGPEHLEGLVVRRHPI